MFSVSYSVYHQLAAQNRHPRLALDVRRMNIVRDARLLRRFLYRYAHITVDHQFVDLDRMLLPSASCSGDKYGYSLRTNRRKQRYV